MLYMLFFCPKSLRTILLTGMAALSLAACTSNGLEAVSATNDSAGEAEAGTEKKEGISALSDIFGWCAHYWNE